MNELQASMIRLGTALKCLEYQHRCVVLSDPHSKSGSVVLVRVTADDAGFNDFLVHRHVPEYFSIRELNEPRAASRDTAKQTLRLMLTL